MTGPFRPYTFHRISLDISAPLAMSSISLGSSKSKPMGAWSFRNFGITTDVIDAARRSLSGSELAILQSSSNLVTCTNLARNCGESLFRIAAKEHAHTFLSDFVWKMRSSFPTYRKYRIVDDLVQGSSTSLFRKIDARRCRESLAAERNTCNVRPPFF